MKVAAEVDRLWQPRAFARHCDHPVGAAALASPLPDLAQREGQ